VKIIDMQLKIVTEKDIKIIKILLIREFNYI